jgi:hypothetical protein
MQKFKQYWLIIIVALVVIAASFYWFQYKPYKARKDCAWTRMHVDAITYKPSQGSEQSKQSCINTCQQKYPISRDFPIVQNNNSLNEWYCEEDSKCDSLFVPEQKTEPEKNWWSQTSMPEYQSCLRGKGL